MSLEDRYGDWAIRVEEEARDDENLNENERDAHRRHAIYEVPEIFTRDEKRKQAYKPQVVSMGPYHHGERQLRPMEGHKRRALRRFLVRTGRSIGEYLDALMGVVQELMDSYKDLQYDWHYERPRFLELMIADGCFMIELMRTDGSSTPTGYDENDPIFSRHGMLSSMPRIKRDMLMIENQIPLLVLKILLSVAQGVVGDQDERSLNRVVNNMVLAFFAPEESSNLYSERDEVELGLHALDVVRKSMIKDIEGGNRGRTEASNDVIWPATQLQEARIKFRKSGSPSLKDVDFSPGYLHSTLSLPQLAVNDATESKFLNLMAFEQLHASSGKEVSSYVWFMDSIIDSEKDVRLLSQNDIIKNFVGTDQAVADIFDGMSHDLCIDPASNLSTVHKKVTEYCKKPKIKAMANFRRGWEKYFYSAWVLVSSVAAAFVLVTTVMHLVPAMLYFYTKNR